MFTGLIQGVGIIKDVNNSSGDLCIEILTKMNLSLVHLGASICCSGCCLTVTKKAKNSFFVEVSAESLSKTTIASWGEGVKINLEPSLKVGDEIGGHFVSGHIDCVTKVLSIKKDGSSHRFKIAIPKGYYKYIAEKASIAIDGISLTINEVDDISFGVNIISHTWNNTTLSDRVVGDMVNMEVDMLARYVARMYEVNNDK